MKGIFYYNDSKLLNRLVENLSDENNKATVFMHPNVEPLLTVLNIMPGGSPCSFTRKQLQEFEQLGIRSRYGLELRQDRGEIQSVKGLDEDLTMDNVVSSRKEGDRTGFYRNYYPIAPLAEDKKWLYVHLIDFEDRGIPVMREGVSKFIEKGYIVTALQAHYNSEYIERDHYVFWGGSEASIFAGSGEIEMIADEDFFENLRKSKHGTDSPLLKELVTLSCVTSP